MLASLLCCNGRFSSDYQDYDDAQKKKAGADEETAFSIPNKTGNLGGLEERPGNESSSNSRRVEYPQDSDKRRLSTLLDSLRAGFGTGTQDGAAAGGAAAAGGEVVVQHVSCRRRRDSNSSSESDSSSEVEAVEHGFRGTRVPSSEPIVSGRKAAGRSPSRAAGQADTESSFMSKVSSAVSSAYRLASAEPPSGSDAARSDRQGKRSGGDVAGGRNAPPGGAGAAREDGQDRREGKRRLPVLPADARPKNGDAKSFMGARSPGHHHPHAEDHLLPPTPAAALGDDDHSSGCSFTSSEWGEVTPTSPSRDAPHPSDAPSRHAVPESAAERREESSSGLDHSSGYLSFPHRNGENLMTMMAMSDDVSKTPASRSVSERSLLKSERQTLKGDERQHVHASPAGQQGMNAEEPRVHVSSGGQGGAAVLGQHVRRHSSGRSEVSVGSARTASPVTKMRLLELASHRALDRDEDSLRSSWSGGSSEDTLSLGMSCSGLRATSSPEVMQQSPLARGVRQHPQPPSAAPQRGNVPDGAESRPTPNISISRPAEPDSAGGSENSGSPEKRLSPHRTSHLSIPSAATGSQSSSHDERSFDDDDDNIDELFAKHRTGSRLSAVRNNIGDSRESLASVYSNAGEINYGRIPVTGDIIFGLDYDHRHSILKIDVRNCQNIAPVDTKHNRSDPYVKVYLLPDKTRSGKRKTKIKKHTLNPVFNEVLTYNISRGELENRTLWVTVWHSDRFGRNDFLGEVIIPMDTYRFDDPSPFTYALESREQESVAETMQYKGELVLSIMYVTPEKVAASSQKSKSKKKSKAAVESTGEVHVMIKSASNLTAVRSNGTSDPFVKGYLLPERARTGKQKTSVVKNSVNPMWNHILVFDGVTLEELADRSLELTVWDHEKLGTNEFLGGARLNTSLGVAKGVSADWMDARGEEASTWQAMIERPNTWIDARIPLRASMGKPSKK